MATVASGRHCGSPSTYGCLFPYGDRLNPFNHSVFHASRTARKTRTLTCRRDVSLSALEANPGGRDCGLKCQSSTERGWVTTKASRACSISVVSARGVAHCRDMLHALLLITCSTMTSVPQHGFLHVSPGDRAIVMLSSIKTLSEDAQSGCRFHASCICPNTTENRASKCSIPP